MALKKPPGALRGDPPHEVFPYLFIGSAANAANKSELSSLGITHILNLKECYFANTPNEFTFLHVAMSDYGNQDIKEVLPECFDFIQSAKSAGGKVLVHCRGGINRSATVVLAWLMFAEKLRLKDAWVLLRSKRAVISPHEAYVQQLKNYEKELFGSITLTEEDHGVSAQEKLRQFMMMGKKTAGTTGQASQSAQAGQSSGSSGRPPMLGALKRSVDPPPTQENNTPPESPSKGQPEADDSAANCDEETPKEKHKKKSSREKSTRTRTSHSTNDSDTTAGSHRSADLSEHSESTPKKSKSKEKLPADEDEDVAASTNHHTEQPSHGTNAKSPNSKRHKKKRDHNKGAEPEESQKTDEAPHRASKKPRPSTSSSSQQPATVPDPECDSDSEEQGPQSDPAPAGSTKKTSRPHMKLASMIVGIFSKKGSEVR